MTKKNIILIAIAALLNTSCKKAKQNETKKQGEKKKAVNIARNLLKTGTFEVKTVAEMTELTEEEVRALQPENDG